MSVVRMILLAAACAAAVGGEACASGVAVPMDNVTLVSFKQPVTTIYMGNPSIADVTLVDSRHVFVLGKRFGTTNLIALSADKSVIANESVTVSSRGSGAVTIFRGADTYNYSCTKQHCETRPVPGDPDGKPFFTNTEGAATSHEDDGNKAASAGLSQQLQH